MEKFILNIKLNVGMIEPKTQEDCVLFHLKNTFGTSLKIQTVGKERNRTMIVHGSTSLNFIAFKKLVQELCFLASQNSIPFSLIGKDRYSDIAYKKGYKGEFEEFEDIKFFK